MLIEMILSLFAIAKIASASVINDPQIVHRKRFNKRNRKQIQKLIYLEIKRTVIISFYQENRGSNSGKCAIKLLSVLSESLKLRRARHKKVIQGCHAAGPRYCTCDRILCSILRSFYILRHFQMRNYSHLLT